MATRIPITLDGIRASLAAPCARCSRPFHPANLFPCASCHTELCADCLGDDVAGDCLACVADLSFVRNLHRGIPAVALQSALIPREWHGRHGFVVRSIDCERVLFVAENLRDRCVLPVRALHGGRRQLANLAKGA